jgi:hypothetical protein
VQRNVGGRDRTIRALLGIGLLVAAVAALADSRTTVAAVAGAAGAGLSFNAATGFCGVNALLGIDTCPVDD